MIGSNLIQTRGAIQWLRSRGIRDAKWQCFTLGVRNSGGAIQCAFFDSAFSLASPPVPELCDRIFYATNEWKTMANINSGSVPFGNVGAGLLSSQQFLLLNTRPQAIPGGTANLFWARNAYQSTNTTRVCPYVYHDITNIFGSGQFYRPYILQTTDFSNAFPIFGAVQIPNGTAVYFDIEGYFN